MQFYIDTADIEEIRQANKRGWVDGVTTNPSLVAKTGRKHEDVIKDICKEVSGLVSAEVISLKADETTIKQMVNTRREQQSVLSASNPARQEEAAQCIRSSVLLPSFTK